MSKFSTGLRKHMLDTGSFKNKLDAGKLRIYAGAMPATADAAVGGATLLVELSDNGGGGGLTFGDATAEGTISKTTGQTWKGTIASSGTAAWFRFVEAADVGDESTTAARIQGTVGTVGTDMVVANAALTAAEEFTLNFFVVTLPTM